MSRDDKIKMVGVSWCSVSMEQLQNIDHSHVDVCMRDNPVTIRGIEVPICDFGSEIPTIYKFPHWMTQKGDYIGSGMKSTNEVKNMISLAPNHSS